MKQVYLLEGEMWLNQIMIFSYLILNLFRNNANMSGILLGFCSLTIIKIIKIILFLVKIIFGLQDPTVLCLDDSLDK